MSRQRVPLGKAARATRRVSSGSGVGSSGWSDIDQLTRATGRILNTAEHAPDRRANPQENDFATSVLRSENPDQPPRNPSPVSKLLVAVQDLAQRHSPRREREASASLSQRVHFPIQQAVLPVQRFPIPARHRW